MKNKWVKIGCGVFFTGFLVLACLAVSWLTPGVLETIKEADIKVIEVAKNAFSMNEAQAEAEQADELDKPVEVVDEVEQETAQTDDDDGLTEAEKLSLSMGPGFTPDRALVDVTDEVTVRDPADDISDYRCFPQDYSEGDTFNRDCAGETFPWGEARAGYSFGYNDACRDVSRFCNIQVVTYNWVVVTGEEIDLPGIGSVRDPDGGASMVVILNAWEVPGELERAYILHGFWATGEVWDLSDLKTVWDEASEQYIDNEYGDYSLETTSTIRDHYLYNLSKNHLFRGQCSFAENCETVTWVTVIRWFDGTYHLVGSGQWER